MRTRLALLLAVACMALLGVASTASACVIPKTLGVAFSIDDSGSMADTDPDLLRAAATGAGIDQLADGSVVAASSFDSSSRALLDPVAVSAANREALKTEVRDRLFASGQTYYDLGLARAKRQLDAMAGVDKRAVIFLSDGAPNGGDYSDELAALTRAAIPVFTIGFADAPGPKLATIAAQTGGQAYTVQSAGEAQSVFARIVSTLTCDATQVREVVTLQPNETRTFPFVIGPSDREFRALAAWLYGDVNVRIRRSNGSYLLPGAELAGERFISESTYASIVGTNPAVGGWQLEVTASPENSDEVDVSIDVFRRTSADPPDAFAVTAPATGARMRAGPATFSWGARVTPSPMSWRSTTRSCRQAFRATRCRQPSTFPPSGSTRGGWRPSTSSAVRCPSGGSSRPWWATSTSRSATRSRQGRACRNTSSRRTRAIARSRRTRCSCSSRA